MIQNYLRLVTQRVNSKADLIILLIEFQSLSNSIVEGIHETIDSENESWWLINGLRQLFLDIDEFHPIG